MGLFGLLASLFGLGAMGADAVKNTMANVDAQDRAYKNKELYSVEYRGGRIRTYSTETGRECDTKVENGHKILYDKRTGMMIYDYTAEENERKTREAKTEARKNGCRFYKTYEFNMMHWTNNNIYANDDMPGRYFVKSTSHAWESKMIGRCYVGEFYMEVKIEYYYNEYSRKMRFKTVSIDDKNRSGLKYLPSGEILTSEYEFKMLEPQAKEKAIKNGDAFYTYSTVYGSYDYQVTKRVSDGSYWFHATDKKFNNNDDDMKKGCYVPGILMSDEITIRETKERVMAYWTIADPKRKSEAYLLNGDNTKPYVSKEERIREEIIGKAKEEAINNNVKAYHYYDKEKNAIIYRWLDTDEEVKGIDVLKFL